MFIRHLGSVITGTNFEGKPDPIPSEKFTKTPVLTKQEIPLPTPSSETKKASLEGKKISIIDRFFSGASRLLRSIFSFVFGSTPKTSDTKPTLLTPPTPQKSDWSDVNLDD